MKPHRKYTLTVVATVALALYAIVTCAWASSKAGGQRCLGLHNGAVEVVDPDAVGFVHSDSITAELTPLLGDLTSKTVREINLGAIRNYINSLDKVESAQVFMLNNNKLQIRVTPMVPVARIWPASGRSYYINRQGKRIMASPRYSVNVPQLYGEVAPGASPQALLPLLDYLREHPDMNRTISMISAVDTANIILVPAFRGPVINLGDASRTDSKFAHLQAFYHEVMPVKGWEYYDTISLKWDGQIVATRRKNKLPKLDAEIIAELEDEGDEISTMTTIETQQ